MRAALVALVASLLLPPSALASAAQLAPYAHLAGSGEGRALLAHARASMRGYWAGAPARDAAGVPGWPAPPVGLYVSLARGRATRACVGSAAPVRGTLAETVRALAVEALHADRRRPPVRREELDDLRIILSFTDEGETITNPMLVDPGREGLLVSSPRGAVAFLPGEARTVRWALREARRIGVLKDGTADASFSRFHVVTLAEPARAPEDEEDSDELP